MFLNIWRIFVWFVEAFTNLLLHSYLDAKAQPENWNELIFIVWTFYGFTVFDAHNFYQKYTEFIKYSMIQNEW